MGNILSVILYFVIIIALMFLSFTLGRKYIFSKVRINKWIPLAIAIVLFILQVIVRSNNIWVTMGFTISTVWFFMWFIDIQSTGGPKKKEKKIEIRPKAKPNRAKHIQNEKK
ncbi:hypothetical protein [Clostridium nigeriense]|uniref:hypothetical protein n=1 Tax=Clostridium nigeriense TaxID=1805470 RepID=UPI000831B161|nr:hypothetical protein [Clostridium nigeriense]